MAAVASEQEATLRRSGEQTEVWRDREAGGCGWGDVAGMREGGGTCESFVIKTARWAH